MPTGRDKIYETVSKHFNIGSREQFDALMSTSEGQKRFYDTVSGKLNIGTPDQFFGLANDTAPVRQKDAAGRQIVPVAPVPKGETGQGGYAEVVTLPGATVTAVAPKPSEMTPEDRRVREYVQSQRFYAGQRQIPRIGPGSRESEMGTRMEMIAGGIQRNPFINPLAPTIGALEGGVAGVRRIGEGVSDVGKGEVVKGGLKTVLGAAETGFSTAMAMSPVANLAFAAGAEAAPSLAEPVMAPVSYLAKPTTEAGKLAAMIGDVAVSAATLHLASKVSPALAARIKEKIDSGKPLSPEEELFIERQKAASQRDFEAEKRGNRRRMTDEIESARRDKTVREYQEPAKVIEGGGQVSEVLPSAVVDAQGRPIPLTPVREARAPLSTPAQPSFPYEGPRSVAEAEAAMRGGIETPIVPENIRERTSLSQMRDQQINADVEQFMQQRGERVRPYEEPARLIEPSGQSSEVTPKILFDASGKPIPAPEVRQARAPLSSAETKSFPYEGGLTKGDAARAVAIPAMYQAIDSSDLDDETKKAAKALLVAGSIGAVSLKSPKWFLKSAAAIVNAGQKVFLPEQARALFKDIKADELKWTGLDDFIRNKEANGEKITLDELNKKISENNVAISERVLGYGVQSRAEAAREAAITPELERLHEIYGRANASKKSPGYKRYQELSKEHLDLTKGEALYNDPDLTVPGGKKYNEILLTAPTMINGKFTSSHWEETPNVFAHIRLSERESGGKKFAFAEEIQSDLHQAGRKRGYADSGKRVSTSDLRRGPLPDAPFKKDWHEVAFRRLLSWAIDKGYDGVAWTNGELQADRFFEYGKYEDIQWRKDSDGNFHLDVQKSGGRTKTYKLREDQIPGVVGDYIAKQITDASKIEDSGIVAQKDMNPKMGGMKKFYDEILPSYANKFGKKFNSSVSQVTVGRGREKTIAHYLPITDQMRSSIKDGGVPLFSAASPLLAHAVQYTDLDDETKSQIERGLLFAGIGALGAKFIKGKNLLAIAKKGKDFVVAAKDRELARFKTEAAAEQFAQQEAGISLIAVSPFYDTKVTNAAEAAALRKTEGYKKQQQIISDVAQRMGIGISGVKENIGGWNNFKEISNTVSLKTDNMERAENYAAIVGALANETQEATIAARYLDPAKYKLSDDIVTAVEHDIPVKDSDKALKALDAAGVTDFTMDETGKRIVILDFGKGNDLDFREKLTKLVGELKKEDNLNGSPEHSYTQSSYIGPDERGAILSKLGVRFEPSKGGSGFGDLVEAARKAHEEFQRKKDPVGSQYNVRQIDDGTRVYEHKGGPLDIGSIPIKEVVKDDAPSFEVTPPKQEKTVRFPSLADAHSFVGEYREKLKLGANVAREYLNKIYDQNNKPGPPGLMAIAGATYGIEKDDNAPGGFRINPTKMALGILGGAALASVRLNPAIREKLARAVGRSAASMSDAEIVAAYEKLAKGREVGVRKPNEKLYVENVNVEKFSDPAAATEALTGITQKKIENSRAKMTDADITELAKKQGEFIKRVSEGKVVPREAYLVEEVRAMKSEIDRVLQANSGKPFKDWPEQDKNVANVARAFIGAAAEGGRVLREFGRPVDANVAAFLKAIDPTVELAEKDIPTILDKIAEFGGAMKLTSASGIIRSTIGNAVSRALYYPELITSVGANKLIAAGMRKGRDRFAEEAAVNQIIGKASVMKALGTAMDILKGDPAAIEQNQFLKSEGYSVEGAIGGKLGHVIRTPYRAQGAVDAVFREPLRDMELSRIAIREAYKTAKAGETTADIMNRAQQYFDSAPEEWKKIADERAKYFTFQNKGGAVLQGVNALRSSTPVIRWFVPFFNTGVNLTKYAIERTPLAPLTPSFIQAAWEAIGKQGAELTPMQKQLSKMTGRKFEPGQIGNYSDKVARMVTGSALLFSLPVIADKVLGGEITGNFPEDRNESEAWRAQGKMPYSIKIGGYYIPYRGYEPLSSFLSAYAEYARAKGDTGSRAQAATSAFSSLVKSITENPSLVGVNDLINAFSEEGGMTEKTNKAVASFITGMIVPTIVRQAVSIADPRVLDAQGVGENMQRVIPGVTGSIPAKMDVLGREIDVDKPWAKLAGVTMGKENLGLVEQEFARLKYAPLPPDDKYNGIKLSREQVQALRKSAGKGLEQALGTFMQSPQYKNIPDDIKIAVIDEIKNKIYEAQRLTIIPKEVVRGRVGSKKFLGQDQKEQIQEGIGE